MRLFFLFLCLGFRAFNCSGQTGRTYEELISLSLENSILHREQGVKDGFITEDYLQRVKIFKDKLPRDFPLPKLAKKLGIDYFEESQYSKPYLRKIGVPVLRLVSVDMENDTISVSIGFSTIYWDKGTRYGFFNRSKIMISSGDGLTSTFAYDCASKKWKLAKVKMYG